MSSLLNRISLHAFGGLVHTLFLSQGRSGEVGVAEKRRYFDALQLAVASEMLAAAEGLVADFYRMGEGDWRRVRFDVRTARDLGGKVWAPGVLAEVRRYEPVTASRRFRSRYLYRIDIRDGAVLDLLHRNRSLRFDAALLYVLVHELVHVVRFCRYEQLFEASAGDRAAEEARVHQRVCAILEPLGWCGIAEILSLFSGDSGCGVLKVI